MRTLIIYPFALLVLFFTSIPIFSASNAMNEEDNQLSAKAETSNFLLINATKEGYTTGTVVTEYNEAKNTYDGTDIYKLFTWIQEVADVYTLSECYALAFNKFNSYPFTAPLGVRTTIPGIVSLNFKGADSFKDADVFLINTLDGTEQNLKEISNYEHYLDGTGEVTLFISFRKIDISKNSTKEIDEDDIKISATVGEKINIKTTSNDMIQKVIVYNLVGNIIDEYSCADYALDLNISAARNQICLVQVFTEKNTWIKKVFVK